MKSAALALMICLYATNAIAQQQASNGMAQQQNVTIRLDFALGEHNATSELLAVLPASRAWCDSVSIFFNDQLRQRGPQNLARVNAAHPTYRLMLQPLPIIGAGNKKVGTAYSMIVFRGDNEEYTSSSVGYSRTAKEAASDVLNWTLALLKH